MIKQPIFSIIIVSYNAKTTINKTLQSVLMQSFENYEVIIKDAKSIDGTLENLPKDSRIKIYSEKDTGIYDGMNAAIKYAEGEFLIFLNCGDYFFDQNVLLKVSNLIKDKKIAEGIICGSYIRNKVLFKQPSIISRFYLYRTMLCHQTMFISRNLFLKYGLYDLNYRICADYDFTLRVLLKNNLYFYCDCVVCDYMGGGVSESKKGLIQGKKEYKEIIKGHFSKWERFKFSLKLFFSFRGLRKMIISDRSPKWLRTLYRKIVNKING